MVEAMKSRFAKIYSIELSETLFESARARFRSSHNVEIIHGDSAEELAAVMAKLDQPALFWLDGHYSGDETAQGDVATPILGELTHILNGPETRHVIVIDDARCFGSDLAYPTLAELAAFVGALRSDVDIAVEADSIRITPTVRR